MLEIGVGFTFTGWYERVKGNSSFRRAIYIPNIHLG